MAPDHPTTSGALRLSQALARIGLALMTAALAAYSHASAVDEPEAGWRFLTRDTPYSIRYYETQAAPGDSPGHFKVWTRTIPTAEGNPQISEIRSLWEIDCEKGAFRNLRTTVVYKEGHPEEVTAPRDWTESHPGVWVHRLLEIVCGEGSGRSKVR